VNEQLLCHQPMRLSWLDVLRQATAGVNRRVQLGGNHGTAPQQQG